MLSGAPRSLPRTVRPAGTRRAAVSAPELLGRAEETAALTAFLDRTVREGAVLLIHGAPGVGKSALLEVAAERAAADGVAVLRATGAEFEADLAFSALHLLLGPLAPRLGEIDRPHRDALAVALGLRGGTPPDRAAVADATVALLRRSSAGGPVLLCLDDLHWFDRSSAEVLGRVARRIAGDPVGLLAVFRTGVESWFEQTGLPQLEVPPLDEEAATTLVRTRFPGIAPPVLARLVAMARGNPLALLELPAQLTEPQRAARTPLPAVLPIGDHLEDVFAGRARDLPRGARALLLLAALESSAGPELLRRAWTQLDSGAVGTRSLDTAAFDLAVQQLSARSLVTVDAARDVLDVRHPLVRSAVVRHSPDDERRRSHAALAVALRGDPDRHAWHRARAVLGKDEDVAALLDETAHRALGRGDPSGAVDALVRAADLSTATAERRRRLAEAAYLGVRLVGDPGSASGLLAEAQQGDADSAAALPAALAAALLLLNADASVDTAFRLLLRTVEDRLADLPPDDPGLIESLRSLTELAQHAARAELWGPLSALLARLPPAAAGDVRLHVATTADPAVTAPPALPSLEAAIAGLAGEVDGTKVVRLSVAAFYVDRAEACRAPLLRVVRDARSGVSVANGLSAYMQLGFDDLLTGRWDEGVQLAEEGLALVAARGYPHAEWPFHFVRAAVSALRGDEEAALATTSRWIGWASPRGVRSTAYLCRWVRAVAASGAGDAERTFRELTALGPPEAIAYTPWVHWTALELVESALRTGRRREAEVHVEALHRTRVVAVSPRAALLTTAAAACVAPDDDAEALFARALGTAGTTRWRFDRARVELACGERLRRLRALRAARLHLTEAHGVFAALGAAPWTARAAVELAAAGGGPPGARPPAGGDPALLTPRERVVAQLAAEGLSNRQIGERLHISHRTVGIHLHRVFPKLGITTRAALRDALRSSPAGEGP